MKKTALDFLDWIMTNCELSKDQSLWSYEGEDYTNGKLFKIFVKIKQTEKILLNDYGCIDDFKVDKVLDSVSVIVPKGTFYCDCVQPSMQKPISETEDECFDCGREVKH
jgi:hypothetical protein